MHAVCFHEYLNLNIFFEHELQCIDSFLLKGDAITACIFFKSSSQPFFVICTRFIRLMVSTGLIGAVKPNTKAFKQNNLKSAQPLREGKQNKR